jgi:hypothetical protein
MARVHVESEVKQEGPEQVAEIAHVPEQYYLATLKSVNGDKPVLPLGSKSRMLCLGSRTE